MSLQFKIKSSFRPEISFFFGKSKTVKELKEKISKVSGIEASNQRLIYKGRILKENRTLESYKVEKDTEGVKLTFTTIKKIGTIYAIIMALGFASMPIYFLLGGGN